MTASKSADRPMSQEPPPDTVASANAPGLMIDGWVTHENESAIQLDSCTPFERIVVRTRGSVYELIVLSGRTGEVMVRGGRFFANFAPRSSQVRRLAEPF